jgi:hypothetical protein
VAAREWWNEEKGKVTGNEEIDDVVWESFMNAR